MGLVESYGTNLGEKFAATALEKYYETAVQPLITNDDYEKMISPGGASKISILTYGDITLNAYTKGTPSTPEDPTESEGELDPNQEYMYHFKIHSLSAFESYVKNPETALIARANNQLKARIDAYILGLYADVGSGNRVGTNYTTGSVEVEAVTGVTFSAVAGPTFTAGMIGLGIKLVSHTKWYRIKSYQSATGITIENDSDDDASSLNIIATLFFYIKNLIEFLSQAWYNGGIWEKLGIKNYWIIRK